MCDRPAARTYMPSTHMCIGRWPGRTSVGGIPAAAHISYELMGCHQAILAIRMRNQNTSAYPSPVPSSRIKAVR